MAVNAYFKSYEIHLDAANPAELPRFQAAAQGAQDFIQSFKVGGTVDVRGEKRGEK